MVAAAAKSQTAKGKSPEEEERAPPGPPVFPVKDLPPSRVCVIDNGAWQTKAGFASEILPRVKFPTKVGQSRNKGVSIGMGGRDCYVGHACEERQGMLNVSSPIKDGLVQNWADMERLWAAAIYDELRIAPDQHAFLITESALTPHGSSQRAKIAELFFEGFAVEGLYIAVNSVMSLYAAGLTTGVVVDSGHDLSMAVPIHEGYTLTRQISHSKVAGGAVTEYLRRMLAEKGYCFTTSTELDVVTNIKETLGFISLEEDYSDATAVYTLPDGLDLKLESERHRCGECLFDFGLLGGKPIPFKLVTETEEVIESSVRTGLSTLLYHTIAQCEPSLQSRLYNSIVTAGGSSLFPGTRDRLHRELYRMYREGHPTENPSDIIKDDAITESPQRAVSSWIGGSMLGMLTMFSHMLVQRAEYNEIGAAAVHTKCF